MPDYIDVPIETDPERLAEDAFTFIQTQWPGWSPAPANLETWTVEAIARMAAELMTVASSVPRSLFRFIGPLYGVNPIDATPARVAATWTMIDNAGYTIRAGTQVGIRTAGDTLVPFTVLADVTVAAGDTVTADGGVTLVAVEVGAAGSGLGTDGGPVELIDSLAYIDSIVQVGITTGGVDGETDDAYLSRLRAELQLQSPRPIVPSDFAVLALNTAGVARAVAMDGYNPAENEIQTVTVDAAGGTFTLTFAGQTTAAIDWDANAVAVQSALEALSNIAPGDIIVTGGPEGTNPITVEFIGTYAATNVGAMTADSTSLTGGTHTATVATVQNGHADSVDNPRTIAVALMDANGNDVTTLIEATVAADLESKREVNFLVHVIRPTRNLINVTFNVAVTAGADPDTVVAAAEQTVIDYLSAKQWGTPASAGDETGWVDTPTVRYLELAQVINQVPGVDYIPTTAGDYDLQIALEGDALARVDVALVGPAAVPEANTITGTHS
jgi:hypothetical protein